LTPAGTPLAPAVDASSSPFFLRISSDFSCLRRMKRRRRIRVRAWHRSCSTTVGYPPAKDSRLMLRAATAKWLRHTSRGKANVYQTRPAAFCSRGNGYLCVDDCRRGFGGRRLCPPQRHPRQRWRCRDQQLLHAQLNGGRADCGICEQRLADRHFRLSGRGCRAPAVHHLRPDLPERL